MEKFVKSQKKSSKSKIEKIQKRFEDWRATREKRTIPEELWQAAVDLYPEYKISQIAKATKLGHKRLKKKISESQTRKESNQGSQKESKRNISNNGQQARIEEIRRELEEFRKNNRIRSRIPESIWQAAAELSLESSPHKIAKTLRLYYPTLKKRLNLLDRNTSKAPAILPCPTPSPNHTVLKDFVSSKGSPAFIQLDIPSPPKSIELDQNEFSIEMENTDGAKMKIGVKSTQMLDIAAICQNFLRC